MSGDAKSAVAAVESAMDSLLGLDLTALSGSDLTDLARDVEQQIRRRAAFDHALIAQLEARGIAGELGARGTADLLRQLLRIGPAEATARVRAAGDLGPQVALTGAPLPAIFPAVAAAQAAGDISPAHARVITATIDALPAEVQARHGDEVERFLLQHAVHLDPNQLGKAATRLRDTLDQDGTLAEDADRARRRHLSVRTRPDGSSELTGELTAACAATWQAILTALAAPRPAEDGDHDPRTSGQRRHDALLDAGLRLLRSGDLPDAGGAPVTILARVDAEQLASRTGHASTATGELISLPDLLHLAEEADLLPVYLNASGGILGYGRTRRTASPGQRRALAARDGGCSFPSCTIPPDWAEAHHVIAWIEGGPTDLDNLTLLCGVHHREFERRGWSCQMTNGVPEWIPPPWLDAARTPRRNTAHHLSDLFKQPPEVPSLGEQRPQSVGVGVT